MLSKRKVLRLTGFYPSVGKIFVVFASFVWKVPKKAIAELNIIYQKSAKTVKLLSYSIYVTVHGKTGLVRTWG